MDFNLEEVRKKIKDSSTSELYGDLCHFGESIIKQNKKMALCKKEGRIYLIAALGLGALTFVMPNAPLTITMAGLGFAGLFGRLKSKKLYKLADEKKMFYLEMSKMVHDEIVERKNEPKEVVLDDFEVEGEVLEEIEAE